MSANMTHSTKILAVNHKHLSNDIIDPLFLWYLWVGSVKAEPQWPKYPNLSVKSFVTSKKPILEFYSVAKMVQYIGHLFACAHNSLSLCLPLGCACNLLPPHLPWVRWGRWDEQTKQLDEVKKRFLNLKKTTFSLPWEMNLEPSTLRKTLQML
jgi:hypothetical protein